MEPGLDSPALPGLVALELGGGPAPRRVGGEVRRRAADGPFAFFAGAISNAGTAPASGRRPEPPAHRSGVVRTAGGLRVAGAVRLDARAELAAKLGVELGAEEAVIAEARWRSDLELAARAVERWGSDAGENMRGDLSLCAWDPRRRVFLAFRDPFGVLPLYLRRVGDVLLLSTSHRLLRGLPPRLDEPDEATLADFLLFGESVEPAATGWLGLRAVAPGHLLRARLATATPGAAATVEERRYHHFTAAYRATARLGVDEAAEAFREALDLAVADRLSPVTGSAGDPRAPVGVLASGGLDASLVAASLALGTPCAPPVRTYTYSYRRLLGDDSGEWARRVADSLELPAEILAADDLLPWSDGGDLIGAPATPIHEPYFAVAAELARRARRDGCAVLLTGEGGDDLAYANADDLLSWLLREPLAAGLAVLAAAGARRGLPRLGLRSALLRRLGLTRLYPASRPWRPRFPAWLDPDMVMARLGLDHRWQEIAELHGRPRHGPRGAALDGILHPRAEAVHRWYDVPAAAAGVEFRHPFLDHRVVEVLLALQPFPHCRDKEVLRRSARGRLPRAVSRRPKSLLPDEPLLAHLRGPASLPTADGALHPDVARFLLHYNFEEGLKLATRATIWADTRPYSLHWWLREHGPGK